MYTTTIVLVQWGLLDVSSSSGWPTTNPLRTMCRRQQIKLCHRRLLPRRRRLLLPRDIQAAKTDPWTDNPDNLSLSSSSPSFRSFCGGNRSGHGWRSPRQRNGTKRRFRWQPTATNFCTSKTTHMEAVWAYEDCAEMENVTMSGGRS